MFSKYKHTFIIKSSLLRNFKYFSFAKKVAIPLYESVQTSFYSGDLQKFEFFN
jgi:hypothetical protein